MREVFRTHHLSTAEVMRIALEAEDIEVEVVDAYALGYSGLAGEIRIAVSEADYERACAVVASSQSPSYPKAELASWRWQKPGCVMLGAAALLGIAGLAVASRQSLKWLQYGLLGLAAVVASVGSVVTLIGMVIATREQLQEGRDL